MSPSSLAPRVGLVPSTAVLSSGGGFSLTLFLEMEMDECLLSFYRIVDYSLSSLAQP